MNPGTQSPLEHDDARGNDLALVEAALFLSTKPMSRRALATILGGVAQAYVDDLLEDLAATYEDPVRGIELHVKDGRAMLRVKPTYVDRVAHLAPQQDIPRPVLRTLAVIAYNNPMTQADVIRVRGNKAYTHIQKLLERRLIRAEDHGRTLLLHVTAEFLRHFGLSSIEEFKFHVGLEPELQVPDEETAQAPLFEEDTQQDDATDATDDATPVDAVASSAENGTEPHEEAVQNDSEEARTLENEPGG